MTLRLNQRNAATWRRVAASICLLILVLAVACKRGATNTLEHAAAAWDAGDYAQAAEEYGKIFAELRRAGRVIQQVDMQIAAIARTLPNCVLVSKDTDFSCVSGIKIENWDT